MPAIERMGTIHGNRSKAFSKRQKEVKKDQPLAKESDDGNSGAGHKS